VLLDLGLGVPHGFGDNGDQVGNAIGELDGSGLNERLDALQASQLLNPLLGREDGLDDGRQSGLDGVGVDALDDGDGSLLGEVLDGCHLVADGSESRAQKGDQEGLDAGSNGGMLSDGQDGIESVLTSGDILLVGEVLF
jgi:hypothetical protein